MKKFCVFMILIILLMSISFSDPSMDEFLISFWGGPENAAQAETIRRAHFNTVMCRPSSLNLCRLYDLRAILFDVTPQMALRLRRDRAVWGYALKDEPENHEFPQIARQAEALRRADPDHPVYINLGWKADPHLFVRILRPQILSFDDYRWWWSNDFLSLLEDYRRLSLAHGVPLLFWVEANTGPDSEGGPGLIYPPDNLFRIRSSVFTALAYGTKGIQWFLDRLIFQGSALTRAGMDVAEVNAELRILGPVLLKLYSHEVFHCSPTPVPLRARALPSDYWIQTSFPEGIMGLFKDSAGQDYVMVVNRGTEKDREVRLRLARRIKQAEILNKRTGRWEELALTKISQSSISSGSGPQARSLSGLYEIRLSLSRGDGQLIRLL
jgi:hypothetical protein